MNKLEEVCCVCFKANENAHKMVQTEKNNKSAAIKLRFCVPEIEWKDDVTICPLCLSQLNDAYEFKEKCLQSENVRKNQFQIDSRAGKIEQYCDICKISFTTSTELKTHTTKTHKKVKPYQCTLCKNRFGCSSNLIQHLKYHEGNRIFICIYCGKSFVTKTDVKIHEKLHLNRREYKCERCPKSFNTHKNLRTHKIVVHTDSSLWQYVCELCSKRFPIKSNYDAHMRRHKNERPFSCHLCEKKFVDKDGVQKHLRSHSNVKSFMCEVCRKEYKDKRVMDIHRAKVHGLGDMKVPVREKKFSCHICPKSYFEKNKLNTHLRRHTGERPHFCKICQKRFTDKSYVTQHMKKVHNFAENGEFI